MGGEVEYLIDVATESNSIVKYGDIFGTVREIFGTVVSLCIYLFSHGFCEWLF